MFGVWWSMWGSMADVVVAMGRPWGWSLGAPTKLGCECEKKKNLRQACYVCGRRFKGCWYVVLHYVLGLLLLLLNTGLELVATTISFVEFGMSGGYRIV